MSRRRASATRYVLPST